MTDYTLIARMRHDAEVTYLRDMLVLWLEERGGSAPLSEVRLYMATLNRSDALTSYAYQTAPVEMDSKRRVRLYCEACDGYGVLDGLEPCPEFCRPVVIEGLERSS